MILKRNVAIIFFILICVNCQTVSIKNSDSYLIDHFESNIVASRKYRLLYRLWRPKADSALKKPLLVFLHGAGERGSDNVTTLKHLLPLLRRADFPLDQTYVLVPQADELSRWVEVDWNLPAHKQPKQPSLPLASTFDLIQSLAATEPIDTNRIYLVGLSMGGFGVWDALSRRPDLFAAGVTVCGGADESTASKNFVPVWAFHGAKDTVVSVERSRRMVAALRKVGADIRYTEYKNEAHGSWIPAFQEKELIEWLFLQHKEQ
ncbi:MAG: prolyl oligopeptidase family serine peptidase [Leptonema sp. (in: Bacteria)]|nr:prolyl oligopeptidase family serine peptidase [Leptonema sp. (in: bacteria)]